MKELTITNKTNYRADDWRRFIQLAARSVTPWQNRVPPIRVEHGSELDVHWMGNLRVLLIITLPPVGTKIDVPTLARLTVHLLRRKPPLNLKSQVLLTRQLQWAETFEFHRKPPKKEKHFYHRRRQS